jgi:peptidyl-prolyl cis-trans isomerase A (cyclophilin A)
MKMRLLTLYFCLSILLLQVFPFTIFPQSLPDQSTLMARAPAIFRAQFKTTQGDFTIEVYREWSPLGADRLYQLLMTRFYDNNALFRVQKGYVVQFGICDDKEVNTFWDRHIIPDEPVLMKNLEGTLSYARDGINSRTVQLFINLKDNPKLDTVNYNGLRGFPPLAKIISGYEVVAKLYGGYGFEPAKFQDSIMVRGNSYLKQYYPALDYIREARLAEDADRQ